MQFTEQDFYIFWNRQIKALERIADALEKSSPPAAAAPNYELPLEAFSCFDWTTIGATVERTDKYGAAVVSWRGLQFIRRSPENRYKPCLWFSRYTGKGDQGQMLYERLATFAPVAEIEVDSLPEKVERLVGSGAFAR